MNSGKYILVNFDLMEYIRPEAFGEHDDLESIACSQEGVLTALIVLLSDGNGRGGGDLHAESHMIGKWAGCRIGIIDDQVTDPELSGPGMADVPLYEQLTKLGTDVSLSTLVAINDGERDYWAPGKFDVEHPLSLIEQRALSVEGRELLLSEKGRNKPIESLEQFFGILGGAPGLTAYTGKPRIQACLDKMALALKSDFKWQVSELQYERGTKSMRVTQGYANTKVSEVKGVKSLILKGTRQGSGASSPELIEAQFRLDFMRGSTTAEVYEVLFPDVSFAKRNEMTENLTSPEVIRLMNLLAQQNNKED